MLVALTSSSLVTLIVVPSPARAASEAPTATSPTVLFDNFTNDTALDTSQWQVNGLVGSILGFDDVGGGTNIVTLQPTFSSTGMEIAQVNDEKEAGSIQSISFFSPPFNATAIVEGTVSNGHTFGFAIASDGASSGVLIYGNLNPANCSSLGDCGDPSTCGIPANSTIGPDQCFYGIDAKAGTGGGGWSSLPKLYLTPSTNVTYTLEINVTASGNADYSVSEGGEVLGSANTQVGTGPFYVILEQAEGSPVSSPGPNVALWKSVSVTAAPTCTAPLAPLAAQAGSPADPPTSCVPVYPTEPSLPTVTLNYGKSVSSPIVVAVVRGPSFPQGLNVLFRVPETKTVTSILDLQPSASGISTITLNITLDCVVANCNQPGGMQLPTSYSLKIWATSDGYTQNFVLQLQLLKAKWLVMMYCAPLGGLEKDIYDNVIQVAGASKANDNPAVGVLVLFYSVYGDYLSSERQPGGTIALYKIANGTITRVGGVWSETNIFDPATLHKFLVTSMAMVPADRNQLILAGHGSGMMGYGQGVGFGPLAYMPVIGLATALSGISPKLEILSFDACYMGELEVLYQLSGYANYFTASERAVPGPGYDYTGFMTSLLKNPDQSTAAYMNVIVSTYRAMYMAPKFQSEIPKIVPTLAAINSSQLGGVVSGLNTLSLALSKDYAANDPWFNVTMLQAVGGTVQGFQMYGDIRSFAQNILNTPRITDPAVKAAASALIVDVKAAVIANTTLPRMYEGLTVLLLNAANVYPSFYQPFTTTEAGLSFAAAANWLPLLQNIEHSSSESSFSATVVTLVHPGHQLYLEVYNSTGGCTGYNPAILNSTGSGIEIIPGTYYLDFGNGTAFAVLPSSMHSFTTIVDGTAMEEPNENYTLTYAVIQNGTVASTKTVLGTISNGTLQSANASIQNGILVIGTSTSTSTSSTSTPSTTSVSPTSTESTTASVASTTQSSSTNTPATSSPITTYLLAGVFLIVIVVAAIAFLARRRAAK